MLPKHWGMTSRIMSDYNNLNNLKTLLNYLNYGNKFTKKS